MARLVALVAARLVSPPLVCERRVEHEAIRDAATPRADILWRSPSTRLSGPTITANVRDPGLRVG